MSRITNALQKAIEDRQTLMSTSQVSSTTGPVNGVKEQVQREVHRFEQALARRSSNGTPIQSTSSRSADAAAQLTPEAKTALPSSTNSASTWSPIVNEVRGSESLGQAIDVVTRKLGELEQQVATRTEEQASVTAQLDAADQQAAKIEQERTHLRQRLEETEQAITAVEKSKAAWARQLEALRQCQALSTECRKAEQELTANAEQVAQTIQARERLAQELAQHERQGEGLRQRLEQLRFQLAKALALTGTTDPGLSEETKGFLSKQRSHG